MSKKCARCEKTVYPTEELKCLDKVWHKICFKCKECGMSLNMRNYKGFNKEPYCEAHIPKATFTTMATTPEILRIAENTKLQSNVAYHASFEKSKGKFTQVADDPEIQRIKQNTQHISNVAYHGELARKAQMEQRRGLNSTGENGFKELPDMANANMAAPAPPAPVATITSQSQHQQHQQQQQQQHSSAYGQHHSPPNSQQYYNPNIQQQPQQHMQQPQQPMHHHQVQQQQPQQQQQHQSQQQQQHQHQSQQQRGMTEYDGSASGGNVNNDPYAARSNTRSTVIYRSDQGAINNPPQRQIGSVHDMDPINHNYGSLGRVYKAVYDYQAQDDDEVSFVDGDLIVNVRSIDGGWMTGEVQRTGKVGMLPANYVELASI